MTLNENATLQGGKYRIISTLGQGGFGITYLAEHTILGNKVAIKEFFPKDYCDRDETTSHITLGTRSNEELVEKLRTRFVSEAQLISSIQHPGIIKIHDIFYENDTAYYTMEFVEGEPLSSIVKREGALPRQRALRYITALGEAVAHIHDHKMTHLDIKPANVMLRKSDDFPILIDFGLSKQYGMDGQANSSMLLGISQGYSPLEQYTQGAITSFSPQTDIYALGATYFNLLTGLTPPDASEVMEKGIPIPPYVAPNDANAIAWAMRSSRADRCPNAKAFLQTIYNTAPSQNFQPQPMGNASEQTQIHAPNAQNQAIQISPAMAPPSGPQGPTGPTGQSAGMGGYGNPPYQFDTGAKKGSRTGLYIGIGIAVAIILGIVLLAVSSDSDTIGSDSDEKQSSEMQAASADSVTTDSISTTEVATTEVAAEAPEPKPVALGNHRKLSGKLGKYPVQVELNLSSMTGKYRYTKSGSGAYLDLYISSYDPSSGDIYIEEYNDNGENTGIFNGCLHEDGSMTGTFINYKGDPYNIQLSPR